MGAQSSITVSGDQTQTPKIQRNVFISGSLGFTKNILSDQAFDKVQRQIAMFAQHGDKILIGDANRGLDDDAANQLNQLQYPDVKIAGTNDYPRGLAARNNTNLGNWECQQLGTKVPSL